MSLPQASRAARTSGRSRSAARVTFFERVPEPPDGGPQGGQGDGDLLLGPEFGQGQVHPVAAVAPGRVTAVRSISARNWADSPSTLASTVLAFSGCDWGSERRGNTGIAHVEMAMKKAFEMPQGWYPQVVHFAGMARRRMALYGMTEQQLGAVAVAARRHAVLAGERAVLSHKPLTLEDYLATPYLAEPYRKHDCCVVNDGAAAFVMTAKPS